MIKPTAKELKQIKLESQISDILLDIQTMSFKKETTSDLQGYLGARAKTIIKLVKESI